MKTPKKEEKEKVKKIKKLKKKKDFTVLLATSQLQELMCNLQTQACEPWTTNNSGEPLFVAMQPLHLRTTSLWHYYAYKIQKKYEKEETKQKRGKS